MITHIFDNFHIFPIRLTYTMAFLHEVNRYFTIAPLAGPRRVVDDVIIDGHLIPKDSTVLISIGDIHHDSKIWDRPDQFIPERFIDDAGNIKNTEHLYTFGIGECFFGLIYLTTFYVFFYVTN